MLQGRAVSAFAEVSLSNQISMSCTNDNRLESQVLGREDFLKAWRIPS